MDQLPEIGQNPLSKLHLVFQNARQNFQKKTFELLKTLNIRS